MPNEISINDWCKKCYICIEFCPIGVFRIKDDYRAIKLIADYDKCVGCGKCEALCPDLAIRVKEVFDMKLPRLLWIRKPHTKIKDSAKKYDRSKEKVKVRKELKERG